MSLFSMRTLPLVTLPLLAQLIVPHLDACNHTCASDADSDGVCDPVDTCAGFDDALDGDFDGVPDGCDACPASSPDDANGDGLCDGVTGVTLSGLPPDMAILQRDSSNNAAISLTGTVGAAGYDQAVLEVEKSGTGSAFLTLAYPLNTTTGGPFTLQGSLPAGLTDFTVMVNLRRTDGQYVRVATRFNVAVGDLLLIQGQSNAVAADYFSEGLANAEQNPFIRSFGSASTDANTTSLDLTWGLADGQSVYAHGSVGSWGLHMAANLLKQYSVPIGLINGAVGGTYIAQHQRNDGDPEDLTTIYGRFLYRANRSGFAANARYLIWYQGESDGYGTGDSSTAAQYTNLFGALRKDWKADFPKLEKIYVFQVRNGCGLDNPWDATLYMDYFDSAGALLSYQILEFWAGSSWTKYGMVGTAPANTAFVASAIVPGGYGVVDVDDISVKAADGSELMLNPGLETGASFPDSWGFDGTGVWSWMSTGAHGGSRAMALESQANVANLYQFGVGGPGTYTESAWARREYNGSYYDIREVLRRLPSSYPDVTVMSTTGAPNHDGCHFYYAGYKELGDRITRLVARDYYGGPDTAGILPPQPTSATWSNGEIRIVVSQAASGLSLDPWVEQAFRVDGAYVTAVRVEGGNTLVLTLSGPTTATSVSYSETVVDGEAVRNSLGVGMVSFYGLPIGK